MAGWLLSRPERDVLDRPQPKVPAYRLLYQQDQACLTCMLCDEANSNRHPL